MRSAQWLFVMVILVLSAPLSATEPAETPGLVPSDALVTVVVPDLAALGKNVNALAGKLSEGFEIPDMWNLVLQTVGIKAQQKAVTRPDGTQVFVDLPTTIDRKKALLVVIPNMAQFAAREPFDALMIPVTDYEKFLEEIALLKSTKDDVLKPQPTADGYEHIGEFEDEGLFFMKRGDYAVMARSPDVLSAFKKENTTLLSVMTPDEKKLLAESDVYTHLNYPQALKTFKDQLLSVPDTYEAMLKQAQPQEGAPDMQPMIKIIRAEFKALVDLGEQLGAGDLGAKISADGVRLACLTATRPDTMLGRMVAAQQPQPLSLLAVLNTDAMMAGGFYITPGSTDELADWSVKFMEEAGMAKPGQPLEELKTTMVEMNRQLKGQTVFAMYPSREPRQGMFRMAAVYQTTDPAAMGQLLMKQLEQVYPSSFGATGLEVKVTRDKDVEPGIERATIELSAPGAQEDPMRIQMLQVMRTMYGEKIVLYTASASNQAGKYTVLSWGDWTTETVKTLAADITAGKAGTLLKSPGYTRATAGLPQQAGGLFFMDSSQFIVMSMQMMSGIVPGMPPIKVTGPAPENASGVGMTISFLGNTMRTEVNVPTSEMLNVKQVFMQIMAEAAAAAQNR